MDCLHSMAPDDEELLRFALDGEPLREEAREHLAQCETCQHRLAMFKQVNTALTAQLYRSQCPSAEQLSFYCANLLSPDDNMHIAAHILDCPLCSAEVADTRRFMTEVEPLPVAEFSPQAVVRNIRRIAASLVRQQAQFVLRGADAPSETGWPRQYRAEIIDLSLHLSRASNGDYLLLGILTSTDNAESVDAFECAKAELYPASNVASETQTPIRITEVDDLGNIVFNAVPIGQYTLLLHLPEREIVIEDITIE
jgi:anti-sigma factor RsiW